MHYQGEFNGSITINGIIETKSVSVFIGEDSLSINPAGKNTFSRMNFSMSPFTRYMLFTQDLQEITEGFFYEISGTNVGSFSEGPLGHPGDGEYDYRPVRSVRLDVAYDVHGINAQLNGVTEVGIDGFQYGRYLEPWKFEIKFTIPKEEMKEFFKISEPVWNNVNLIFDQAFKKDSLRKEW